MSANGNRRSDVKRLLTFILLASVALAGQACGRLEKGAVVMDPDEAVRLIREESDQRRPAYRSTVVERYTGIVAKRAEEWALERSRLSE